MCYITHCALFITPTFSWVHREISVISLIVLYLVPLPLAGYIERLVLYLLLCSIAYCFASLTSLSSLDKVVSLLTSYAS